MKNIPNQITVSRIILVFIFVLLSSFDTGENFTFQVSKNTAYICHVIALIVAVIAALTDLLDGYLARKLKVESDFGRLVDPLADKIFVLATYTMMVSYDLIPGWFLIIILAREFVVTGLRTLASAKGVIIAADRWGKLKTALQMIFLAIGGLSWIHFLDFDVHKQPFAWMWWIFMGVVMVITISSGLGYFIKYRKLYMESI
ncbi:MAG: CDP-diacylglycerol--glycerol-3-phosphate 3-phosphatidyltransferase [Lentisphaeria bacterium]|nr:CDP-diacylglycerol--glycerol-3-phosphate 3-phosphatidyltransferase [Lentisphaeria bacterium]